MVALALLALNLPGLSVAQEAVKCESDYVVQSGDWLAKIAVQHYGDDSLYPAIVLATNARSASDGSYATIADPWRIEPGWKLCLPSVQRAQSGFTVEALKNAGYLSGWTASGKAALSDGEYRESIAPGSATQIVVVLSDRMAFGYTSDGEPLAAVILITDPGGSGTFYSLAAVFEQDGKPVNIATTLLGDRVKINSLIVVDFTGYRMGFSKKMKLVFRYLRTWGLPPRRGQNDMSPGELVFLVESAGFKVEDIQLLKDGANALYLKGVKK